MNDFLTAIGVLTMAYIVGSIPFGFLIGKLKGIDIRKHGSGNIGATNLTRQLGREWGIFCFSMDFLKGLAPVLVARRTGGDEFTLVLAGMLAIIGHIWPVFLKFKGGKGVATSLGALLALTPAAVLIAMAAWFVTFKVSRYVSLASIVAVIMLPLGDYAYVHAFSRPAAPVRWVMLMALAVLIIWRHRTNIARLRRGEEHRFVKKKT